MRKLMIPCPMPAEPINVGELQVGRTQWVPIEFCATQNDGKNCPFLNIPHERVVMPDFDKNNIQPTDYMMSNGIDLVSIGCGFPRELFASIMEIPDIEPSKIIRLNNGI